MTDDSQPTPLDRLAAFAREQAERLRAAGQAAATERREREARQAAAIAADEYAVHFTTGGNPPPELEWTGYGSTGQEGEPPYRIQATAYLGEGVFLAFHRPRPGDDFSRHIPFTLIAADHPDTYDHPAHVDDVTALAAAAARVKTARHAAAVARWRNENQ
jgi:hypothetical protein